MIRPRWNRQANALLANIGAGSPRLFSSQGSPPPERSAAPPSMTTTTRTSEDGVFESQAKDRPGDSIIVEGDIGVSMPPKEQLEQMRRQLSKGKDPTSTTSSWSLNEAAWRPVHQAFNQASKSKPWSAPFARSRQQGPANTEPANEDAEPRRGLQEPQEWPQLKRKSQSTRMPWAETYGPQISPRLTSAESRNNRTLKFVKNAEERMLILSGLSPNLSTRDFYRLAPSNIANFHNVIQEVQQQRSAKTLEPTGTYFLTFNTADAALAFQEKLVRLHRLGKLRFKSSNGLWESTVPPHLKLDLSPPPPAPPEPSPVATSEDSGEQKVEEGAADAEKSASDRAQAEPDESTTTTESTTTSRAPSSRPATGNEIYDLETLVKSFTLKPAFQDKLLIARRRAASSTAWADGLSDLVRPLGYGDRPHMLLVDVYPPTMAARELAGFIQQDGLRRGLRWQVSAPLHLKEHYSPENGGRGGGPASGQFAGRGDAGKPSLEYRDHDTWEKLKSRFVLAFPDGVEAARFQRSWNSRTLTVSRPRPARYVLHASRLIM